MLKRDITEQIHSQFESRDIILITGPRSAGKSTLLQSIKNELKYAGKAVITLSLDDEKDAWNFRSSIGFTQYIASQVGNGTVYICIDNAESHSETAEILRDIYDSNFPYHFIITCTGDRSVKEHYESILNTRLKTFTLKSASFKEFLHFKTQYHHSNTLLNYFKNHSSPTQELVLEYMAYGWYPQVIEKHTVEEKRNAIKEIYSNHIMRDISGHIWIRRTDAYKSTLVSLAKRVWTAITLKEIALEWSITFPTLKQYIEVMERTYGVRMIPPYSGGEKNTNEITKSPIPYFEDIGIRHYLTHAFWDFHRITDDVHAFRNLVANILIDIADKNKKTLHYWQTKQWASIDFVINNGVNIPPLPIEITQHARTNGDITRSMRSFIDRYNPPLAWIITPKYEWIIQIQKTTVRFMPYWYLFLLD